MAIDTKNLRRCIMEQKENRELFLTDTQIIKGDEYDVKVYKEIHGNNVYHYIEWSKDEKLRWKYSFVTLLFYDDDSQDPKMQEGTSSKYSQIDDGQDYYDELEDGYELEEEKEDLRKFITFLSQEEVGGFLDYWNDDDVRRGADYWMSETADHTNEVMEYYDENDDYDDENNRDTDIDEEINN